MSTVTTENSFARKDLQKEAQFKIMSEEFSSEFNLSELLLFVFHSDS